MRTKTLRHWRQQAAKGWPGPGQPGHPREACRSALRKVGRVLKDHKWRCGLGTVLSALGQKGIGLAVRLARWALREWKRHRARREERQRAAVRVRVQVLLRDTVWSQDALHLAGWGQASTWGRVVMDRCTREHVVLALSGPPCSQDSVTLLEQLRLEQGRLPLVLMVDNGSENKGVLVGWAREHQVVLLYNLPHTPQHNGAGERSIGELREELEGEGAVPGLQDGGGELVRGPVCLVEAGVAATEQGLRERLARAWWQLDHRRVRPCLGGRTAAEMAGLAGVAYDQTSRARFYAACCRAVEDAVRGVRGKRARRRAEREAVWRVLEEHRLVIRRRGSAPWPSPKTDKVS